MERRVFRGSTRIVELNASRLSTEEQSEIRRSFLLRMGKSYAERFRSAQKARSLSDSSANETVDDYVQDKLEGLIEEIDALED